MCISKGIMWIISKSHQEKKYDIFAIHSSSRHEKRCQIRDFFPYFEALYTNSAIPIQELCYMYLLNIERLYEPPPDVGCPLPIAKVV